MPTKIPDAHPHRRFVLVAVLFLATRVAALLLLPPLCSDVWIYAGYAAEFEAASRLGISWFEFRALPAAAKQTAVAGVSCNAVVNEGDVFQYPPPALAPMLLPRWAWSAIRSPQGDCTLAEYGALYRLQTAAVDLLLFGLLIVLLRKIYPAESWNETAGRLGVYVAGGLLLAHLIYDRLDLPFAALVTLALGLLVTLPRRGPAMLVLALSIAFKLASVFLVPLWALGSLSVQRLPDGLSARRWMANGLRAAVWAAVILAVAAACWAPALWTGGIRSLAFLDFHRQRGIEIESTYATWVFGASLLGQPFQLVKSFGSCNIESGQTACLAQLSPVLTAIAVLLLSALYYVRAVRAAGNPAAPPAAHRETTGCACAGLTVQMTVACLLAELLTSKVFSPQYVVWLLPVVCLMPGSRAQRGWIFLVFLGVCALTTLEFPLLFGSMMDGFAAGGKPQVLAYLGIAVVALRNLGLVALLVLVAFRPGACAGSRLSGSGGRA